MSQLNMLINKLDSQAKNILEYSANLCATYQHQEIDIAHWFSVLLDHIELDTALNNFFIENEKLLNQLKRELKQALEKISKTTQQTPTIALNLIGLIKSSWEIASINYHKPVISNSDILLSLVTHQTHSQIAEKIAHSIKLLNIDELKKHINNALESSNQSINTSLQSDVSAITNADKTTSALNQYAINLNNQAKLGKLDAVIGRDKEIQETIETSCRRRQNNAILLGEPGVGKTAIVEGLALKIHHQQVPESLANYIIYSLDMGLLLAGASVKGEFENRIKQLIDEIKNSPDPIILFIDEAHSLIGAGNQQGQNDAANLLKPALARGELKCIGATTWAEYKKYFETDPALTRRFQAIKIQEPDLHTSGDILRSTKQQLEKHHNVIILNEAIELAVKLSDKYIYERKLPDKAISVLDTACARVSGSLTSVPYIIDYYRNKIELLNTELKQVTTQNSHGLDSATGKMKQIKSEIALEQKKLCQLEAQWQQEKNIITKMLNNIKLNNNKQQMQKLIKKLETVHQKSNYPALIHPFVDIQAVSQVITDWTGVPQSRLSQSESDNLMQLDQQLKQQIIDQDHAVELICSSIKSSRVGFSDPSKPLGIFMLVGPSGVGKTQTAEVLAENVFGSRKNMISINLSEYKEAHKVSTLAGAPPGYVGYGEGGVLTEAVRRQPYSLVLLDEVEKAHPSIQDFFYQIFDKGMIKDSMGREISFKNTIIILTSNAASEFISQTNKNKYLSSEEYTKQLSTELSHYFKPAFLGRVKTIPYFSLDKNGLISIAKQKLEVIKKRAKENLAMTLDFDKKILNLITQRCQQNNLGARQIDQFIQHTIVTKLSDLFLSNIINNSQQKNSIDITTDDNQQIIFSIRNPKKCIEKNVKSKQHQKEIAHEE